MPKLEIVVVPFRQKIRGTVIQLGTRLGRFLEKIQKDDVFNDERADINSPQKNKLSILCKNQCTSFSLAGNLSSSVCSSGCKK